VDQPDRIVEELLRNARAASKVDRERLELFQKLVTTPAWGAYIGLLNAKIQMFADQLLVPSGSVDGCVAQEFVKGAMSGLVMARDIPDAIIAAKEQFRSMTPEEEDDDEAA
jgi:hypothetical protein